jgi:hypothetical protein
MTEDEAAETNQTIVRLEGVSLESLRTPEGASRAAEIFARNEHILFPLLRWGRNQVAPDTDTGQLPLACGTSRIHPQER